ncbi:hypothetical protein QF042_002872 [Pedobacter sp. W3I1]|uniref:DUF5958 family protein n=1 Tax=Pedobacter sp. W3I1 TaxID=3042291 RepID=UPI002781E606|nr:DUF5958 family protein [Pedobacter sp. W3I1]MDQ0639307.1 hypothetical protein [Pedobacter sp. W3I1]
MNLDIDILINKYGQDLDVLDQIQDVFDNLDQVKQEEMLNGITYLILQSKPIYEDVEVAINSSGLKPSLTPCILLKKGVLNANLQKIIKLPKREYNSVLKLFLNLFKIAYKRRFDIEKNKNDKWWYSDLSDESNINKIRKTNR